MLSINNVLAPLVFLYGKAVGLLTKGSSSTLPMTFSVSVIVADTFLYVSDVGPAAIDGARGYTWKDGISNTN